MIAELFDQIEVYKKSRWPSIYARLKLPVDYDLLANLFSREHWHYTDRNKHFYTPSAQQLQETHARLIELGEGTGTGRLFIREGRLWLTSCSNAEGLKEFALLYTAQGRKGPVVYPVI